MAARGGGLRGRYRRTAASSYVDETLFGESGAPRPALEASKHGAAARGGGTLSRGELLAMSGATAVGAGGRGGGERGRGGAALVVSHGEMARIRGLAGSGAASEERKEEGEERALRAAERKARILAFEKVRESKVPLSALAQEEEEAKERARVLYAHEQDEAMDDVKRLNSMVAYAKMAQIRDRQLAEKAALRAAERESERVQDLAVELARLERVKETQEREAAQRAGQRDARRGIEAQLSERAAAREQARAARVREAEEARQAAVRAREEELAKRAADAEKAAVLRRETAAANAEAAQARLRARAAELAEDARLDEVRAEMDRELVRREIAHEVDRARREELEFRMRGAVQKFNDDREAIDQLRAQRACEAGQRAERERELDRARKRAQAEADLKVSRAEQEELRRLRQAMELEREKAEFDANQRARADWMQTERDAAAARRAADVAHRDALFDEVGRRETRRRADFLATKGEGKDDIAQRDRDVAKLKHIRDEKIRQLVEAGVHPKYTADLHRYNPMDAILKDYKLGRAQRDKSPAAAASSPSAPKK
jgi:Trichohyalin-plectin-homology domain